MNTHSNTKLAELRRNAITPEAAAIKELFTMIEAINARSVRIETRLCKLMEAVDVDPKLPKDGGSYGY